MKNNKLFEIIEIVVLFILSLSISAQAKSQNPLCHTWKNPEYQTEISFYDDGTGFVNGTEKFNWRAGSGYLEIIPGTDFSIYEPISYAFSLRNNGYELTLTELSDVYKVGTITLIR